MSQEDENFADVEGKLFEIPEAKFLQLVQFIEDNLERGNDSTTLRTLLAKMRPRMAQVRPRRRNTVRRQLCQPFEELLFDTKSTVPVDGRIPRTAVDPIYVMFEHDQENSQLAAWEEALGELPIEDVRCDTIGSKIWAQAALTLRSILVNSQRDAISRRDMVERIRGEHIFKALSDVVEILEIADIVQSMRRRLPPRPIQTVSGAVIKVIGEHMEKATKFAPRKAEVLLLVAMGCLERPWEIMEALEKLALDAKKTVDPALASLAVRALVTGAEQRLENLRLELEEGEYKPDAETLAREVADLAKTILGAKSAMQSSGQGRGLDRQLERARRSLRELVMVHILNGAEKAIVTDMMMGGGDAFALGSGLGGWETAPDEGKLRDAEHRAVALRLCVRYAEELGLGGEAEQKVQSLQAMVKGRADDVLDAMGGRYLSSAHRQAVEANLYASVRLVELLAGPDSANELRLKGLAILDE